jgi:hypothetical protein
MSKNTKTPFFTTQSHLIEIIEDPIDFYMNIHVHICVIYHRRKSKNQYIV